jgi:hypothetical protein
MGHSHHFGLVCHLQPHVFFKSHGNPIVVGSRFTVSRSFKMLVTSSLLSRSLTTNKSHSRSCGDWWRKRRPQRKDWHGKSMKMTCGLHHGSMDTIYQWCHTTPINSYPSYTIHLYLARNQKWPRRVKALTHETEDTYGLPSDNQTWRAGKCTVYRWISPLKTWI